MKTCEEFNQKYKDYLPEGWYGCTIGDNEAQLNYLDEKFQEFIKITGFKYHQIKSKFNSYRFYAEGLEEGVANVVINKLVELYENRNNI